ncbi:MAG: IPTL-CTERM sorting domain-containing protein [Candidatus Dadabacteria bacterium]|nr:IPTL-CTERM sorting domain-containing protein [Candidatus Dadabacteria bacterium]MCZ6865093.1 IPTL-CTERM sorting domain-containing protein [Candidatus Dadabacteria bacterium]
MGIVDVSAFTGQSVRISFDWFVPENFTGPGFCQLDNVSVSSSGVAPIPTLSEWGLITMAGILGIVGFMVMRRRKATA